MDKILKDKTPSLIVESNKESTINPKENEEIIKKLNEDIIQAEIEYDELFDLMAKRRQSLEKK